MHTRVHTPQAEAMITWTGTLVSPARALADVSNGDGHTVPILRLELELDNALHTHHRFDQPFPEGQFHQAEAAARRFKPGMRITVEAPLTATRLVTSNTAHVHILPTEQTPEQPPCPTK